MRPSTYALLPNGVTLLAPLSLSLMTLTFTLMLTVPFSGVLADKTADDIADAAYSLGVDMTSPPYGVLQVTCKAPVKCHVDKDVMDSAVDGISSDGRGGQAIKFDRSDGKYEKVEFDAEIPSVNEGKRTHCNIQGQLNQRGTKPLLYDITDSKNYLTKCGDYYKKGVSIHCGEEDGQTRSQCKDDGDSGGD